MRRSIGGLMFACTMTSACATPVAAPPGEFVFEQVGGAAPSAMVETSVASGRQRIEAFFGQPFEGPFRILVAGDRRAFDAAAPADWGITPTQCWMVGIGVADWLALLSPAVWQSDACEHDGSDPEEVRATIAHELTHSFHAQRNPTRDFTGMDDLSWFVEGLAVHVSGQLDHARLIEARDAVAAGLAPSQLEAAWSGRYRYGLSGSMAAYIDDAYGRAVIVRLLAATSEAQILTELGVTEAEFIERWRVWLLART